MKSWFIFCLPERTREEGKVNDVGLKFQEKIKVQAGNLFLSILLKHGQKISSKYIIFPTSFFKSSYVKGNMERTLIDSVQSLSRVQLFATP